MSVATIKDTIMPNNVMRSDVLMETCGLCVINFGPSVPCTHIAVKQARYVLPAHMARLPHPRVASVRETSPPKQLNFKLRYDGPRASRTCGSRRAEMDLLAGKRPNCQHYRFVRMEKRSYATAASVRVILISGVVAKSIVPSGLLALPIRGLITGRV